MFQPFIKSNAPKGSKHETQNKAPLIGMLSRNIHMPHFPKCYPKTMSTSPIRLWLEKIGFPQYADTFEANALELSDLPELTSGDLRDELGITALMHRKKILKAIDELKTTPPPQDSWPLPIALMIESAYASHNTPIFQHNQLILLFGAILRFTAAVLAAEYLYAESITDKRLNHHLLTDLRRPTYGNLLHFIRRCVKTPMVTWDFSQALLSAFSKALKHKHTLRLF